MGKQRKYIYFLILICFLIIYMILILIFFLLGVWVLRKCGKVKRNRLFFFFLISDLFGSNKLEATENRPN